MNKSYYKSELAEMADVSYSTFSRFLRTHRKALERLGSSPKSHILRGKALEYVCREFDIDLPEEELPTAKKHEKFK
jgi:hypothetical protein